MGRTKPCGFLRGRRRPGVRMSKRIPTQSPPQARKRAPRQEPPAQPAPGAAGASTEAQFKKLVEVISRSQLNYRELIDSLDHAVFTVALDGEIRVANRRLSDILGVCFQDLIGHRMDEFVSEPSLAEATRALEAFIKKGHWAGRIAVRLK